MIGFVTKQATHAQAATAHNPTAGGASISTFPSFQDGVPRNPDRSREGAARRKTSHGACLPLCLQQRSVPGAAGQISLRVIRALCGKCPTLLKALDVHTHSGVLALQHGAWSARIAAWCMECSHWSMVHGVLALRHGAWSARIAAWCMECSHCGMASHTHAPPAGCLACPAMPGLPEGEGGPCRAL